ncbi:HAD-IA family hydrolase [uncultured Halopseudomonas sp.]|uniref:HAD family hydrolase n=1 Tax=uncultured Halopseudomonas sp. TaxID=2901193 RepID=UPI0030EC72EF|tara:strand:+ start:12636 stop:13316 length:681 start_codon:yes stop_codon:yes gene_type:complete
MLSSVLFDLDGTLIDTADDFMAIVSAMRSEAGLAAVDNALIRNRVSDGSAGMLAAAYSLEADDPRMAELRNEFLQRYEKDLAVHACVYPGIVELLEWLEAEHIPWGVVTNKLSRFSAPLLDAVGLGSRCHSLVCPDHVTQGKPHPESLLKACSEMGTDPQHCVFIGDHQRDIQAGQAAGMATVAALYGYIPPEADPSHWKATHSIQSPVELRPWLEARRNQEIFDV